VDLKKTKEVERNKCENRERNGMEGRKKKSKQPKKNKEGRKNEELIIDTRSKENRLNGGGGGESPIIFFIHMNKLIGQEWGERGGKRYTYIEDWFKRIFPSSFNLTPS
jgi:hypothetical protein